MFEQATKTKRQALFREVNDDFDIPPQVQVSVSSGGQYAALAKYVYGLYEDTWVVDSTVMSSRFDSGEASARRGKTERSGSSKSIFKGDFAGTKECGSNRLP